MVVDLGSMQSEAVTATLQIPHSTPVLPPPPTYTTEPSDDTTAAINLQLMSAMEQLQQASSIAPASISKQSMPWKQPSSAALGAPPAAKELEDPLQPKGTETATSVPMVIFTPIIPIMMQMPLQVPIPTDAHSPPHHSLNILALLKTLLMMSFPFVTWPQAATKGSPTGVPNKLLQLQEKMNMALEQLLTNSSTMGFWHKEFELNT